MKTKMVHCPDCGEYLGDSVNGVLYKFGRAIMETHVCECDKKAYETGRREIEKRYPHFFDN